MARLVTLFGGGGFLGRYVAQSLLASGVRVRLVERDPKRAFFLRPLGALGQTQFVAADVTKAPSVERAVAGSDAVINLVGILSGRFDAVHVAGAAHVAQAAARAGASAFVHVSAIGADPASPSHYGRSKGEGEAAVRTAFPTATIVRPSILFGPEDNFINRFARMIRIAPVVPVIRGAARLQPAFAGDVGRAVALAALEPGRYAGRTFELGGPEVLTMHALNAWIATAIGRKPALMDVPDVMAEAIARLGFLPGAPLTYDQWLMLQRDTVVAPDSAGFEAFGIDPRPLAAVAPNWLVSYRRNGRFSSDDAIAA